MKSLTETEGSSPPSEGDDQNLDAEMTEQKEEEEKENLDAEMTEQKVEEEEKKKKKKKVAYLRDTHVFALYPSPDHKDVTAKRRKRDGFACEFVSKLHDDISRENSEQRRQEIYLKESHRFLESRGMGELVQKIKSPSDILVHAAHIWHSFLSKTWYFNRYLNHEVPDEYQLLSLGDPHIPEEIIPNLWQLNDVGNTLKADLQYEELFSAVFKEIHWDDTDEQGVRKAIAIRDKYFPEVSDRVIPWLLYDWALYKRELWSYAQTIDLLCQLWTRVEEEKGNFSEVLLDLTGEFADDWLQKRFEELKIYIKKSRLGGRKKSTCILIKEYFEATLDEPKPDGGDYLLFVKEKIRMALELGIIQKEDVTVSEAGSQLLKNIEKYDPCIYSRYDPIW